MSGRILTLKTIAPLSKMKNMKKTKQVGFYLEEHLDRKLELFCAKNQLYKGYAISEAIKLYLDSQKPL